MPTSLVGLIRRIASPPPHGMKRAARLFPSGVIHHGLRPIYGTLSFAVSYGIAEDSSPPPGKKQLDTTLTLALEMAL